MVIAVFSYNYLVVIFRFFFKGVLMESRKCRSVYKKVFVGLLCVSYVFCRVVFSLERGFVKGEVVDRKGRRVFEIL